jgi:hypothetical protein
MALETIYMLQVSKEILSDRLVEYLKNNCDYIDATDSGHYNTKEFIVSIDKLHLLFKDECDGSIYEEIQQLLQTLTAEISDLLLDNLAEYEYIQFI